MLASLAVLALASAPALVSRDPAPQRRAGHWSDKKNERSKKKKARSHFLFPKQAEVVDTGKAIGIIGDGTKSFNKTLPKLVLPGVKDMKKPVRGREEREEREREGRAPTAAPASPVFFAHPAFSLFSLADGRPHAPGHPH